MFALLAFAPYLHPLADMTDTDTLNVQINGETRRVATGSTIAALVAGIGLDPARVAVERNLEIVPRSTLASVPVEDGDAFEIVHFVGGG